MIDEPDITMLQAFAIYLGVLQHLGEGKAAWSLTGVLIRIAASIDLHHDTTYSPTLTFFDAEMRRRLWWQICLLDSRSEGRGAAAFQVTEHMFDTKTPANITDSLLVPETMNIMGASDGWTHMTPFLIRCDVWRLSRRLRAADTYSEKLEIFKLYQAKIHDDYLRHVNEEIPLQTFVATNAKLFLATLDLMLDSQQVQSGTTGRDTSQPSDDAHTYKVFTTSLSITQHHYAIQNEPRWERWRWQIPGCQPPWQSLQVVLSAISEGRCGPFSELAWSSVRTSIDGIRPRARQDPRYRTLMAQLAKAEETRAAKSSQHAPDVQRGDSMPAMDWTLTESLSPASIAQDTTWSLEEPSMYISGDLNETMFGDLLNSSIDWQGWDDMAGEQDRPI